MMRLIKGGLDYTGRIGATQLGVVPLEAPAPELDAVVVEQDTHALLAADTEIDETAEPLLQLAGRLAGFVPYSGGEVVVKRAVPLQLYAIVHDLDRTPSWQAEWIAAALERVLTIATQRQLRRLGMAPLGCVHGRFPLESFIQLLAAAVSRHSEASTQIILGVKRSQCLAAIEQLKRHCHH